MHFVITLTGWESHLQANELAWNDVMPKKPGRQKGEQKREDHVRGIPFDDGR